MKREIKCNHCEKTLLIETNQYGNIVKISEEGWVTGYTVNNKNYLDLCPDCFQIIKTPMEICYKECEGAVKKLFEEFVSTCHSSSSEVIKFEKNIIEKGYEVVRLWNAGLKGNWYDKVR